MVCRNGGMYSRKIVRIGELNTPVPYTVNLESYVIPQVEDIVEGVRSITE